MFDLSRFIDAQNRGYEGYATALEQMRYGRKTSHWIWYIFPQLKQLGKSPTAVYYGIDGLEEARSYAADPVLGSRLVEITQAVLDQPGEDARWLMGSNVDYQKLRSCMTLFEIADPDHDVFARVPEKFYGGRRDKLTLKLLGLAD